MTPTYILTPVTSDMFKSNQSASGRKAASKTPGGWKKPYDGFPLSFHPPSGRLYKKIRGKRYYFGYADDWQAAIDKFSRERDDLYAGREPRAADPDQLTVRDLLNRFLSEKKRQVETGELTQRSWEDYKRTSETVAKTIGPCGRRHRY